MEAIMSTTPSSASTSSASTDDRWTEPVDPIHQSLNESNSEPNDVGIGGPGHAGAGGEGVPRRYIETVLEQSFRHLFGPTNTPEQPRKHEVVSIAKLTGMLSEYLTPA